MTTESEHYYQGGYDLEFVEQPINPRFECSICLLCLRNPHQTSCGHTFCHSCIITWLQEGKSCPHDNCSLGQGDLFPDTKLAQDIDQLLVRCPRGCEASMMVKEVSDHCCRYSPCPQCGQLMPPSSANAQGHRLICPNVQVACPYAGMGCSQRPLRRLLDDHLQRDVNRHLQLLQEKMAKWQQAQSNGAACNCQGLYERLVTLEQHVAHLANKSSISQPSLAHQGRYVWRIHQFKASSLKEMKPALYSPAFYTPAGYKMCLRCSLQGQSLGIFVHFLAGDDDDILSWPFRGRIKLTLKNRQWPLKDMEEMLASNAQLSAFERPSVTRNPVGFGLHEFINVRRLMDDGFWDSHRDDVVIIVQILPGGGPHDSGNNEDLTVK